MAQANLPTRWELMVADHPKLTKASEKAVLFALKTYMDNTTGKCYPTIKQVAARASVTNRTAGKVLTKAESLRIISRDLCKSNNGRGYANYIYYPLIPGETISTTNNQLKEIKTQPGEINNINQEKQFPTNYLYNYLNNYSNNKNNNSFEPELDPNEKRFSVIDVGEEVTIRESQVKTKSQLIHTILGLRNQYAREKVFDWVFKNDLSEVTSREDLKNHINQ